MLITNGRSLAIILAFLSDDNDNKSEENFVKGHEYGTENVEHKSDVNNKSINKQDYSENQKKTEN